MGNINLIDKFINTAPRGKVVDEPAFTLSAKDAKCKKKPSKNLPFLTIVAISDTHNLHNQMNIPEGDILIHSGDFTNYSNSKKQSKDFIQWMSTLPHPMKIVICGNHEVGFRLKSREKIRKMFEREGIHYLENTQMEIDVIDLLQRKYNYIVEPNEREEFEVVKRKLKVFGSPWNPSRGVTKLANAFSIFSSKLPMKWNAIEEDTDVLITHVPPFHILDGGVGCDHLLRRVEQIQPKLHVFGHNHNDHGAVRASSGSLFVNAACKLSPILWNDPVVIHYLPSSDYYFIP